MLQQRVKGKCLQDVFDGLSLPEKLQLTTKVAQLLLQQDAVTLERPGQLVGTDSWPTYPVGNSHHTGNITITGFRYNPTEDMPDLEKQPLATLLIAMFECRKQKQMD